MQLKLFFFFRTTHEATPELPKANLKPSNISNPTDPILRVHNSPYIKRNKHTHSIPNIEKRHPHLFQIEKKHSQLSPDIDTSHPHLPQDFNRLNCVAHLKCPQQDTATTCCNATTSPHTTFTPMPCHHIYNQHTIKKHRAQQNFPPILVMHFTTC